MELNQIVITMDRCKGIGWKTLALFMHNEHIIHAESFTEQDWKQAGASAASARILYEAFQKSRTEEYTEFLKGKGIQAATIFDEEYPLLLKEISSPPWVLYGLGNFKLLHNFSLAVIGTRMPTAYGRKVAEMFTEALAAEGINVVSGMARGIDGIAHEAALCAGGLTTAVLGTAIDKAYPPENTSLYQEVVKKGLVISEYPPGTPPHPGLFPQRNRIIAGLTHGTLVVEADLKSGSLITADQALEAGRDVFAVPGPITSPKSRGTNNLIKQGAKTVTEAAEILNEYGILQSQQKLPDGNKLTEDERRIYHMLEQGNLSFDVLLARSGWDFGHLHSVLLSLIIKKQAVQLPGSLYKLI